MNKMYIGLSISRPISYPAYHDMMYYTSRYLFRYAVPINVWHTSMWYQVYTTSKSPQNQMTPPSTTTSDTTMLTVYTQQAVQDIVGHCDEGDFMEYAICLGCNLWPGSNPSFQWAFWTQSSCWRSQPSMMVCLIKNAPICHNCNVNIDKQTEFCNFYMAETINEKSPWWDECWFYEGKTMHVVDNLLCHAKCVIIKSIIWSSETIVSRWSCCGLTAKNYLVI